MFEAQKLERLRPSQSMSQTCYGCESPKEYAPSLLLGQLQTVFREPLPHFLLEMVHFLSILETHHEIIRESHEVRLASTLRFDLLLKPEIENKVEVEVAQHRRNPDRKMAQRRCDARRCGRLRRGRDSDLQCDEPPSCVATDDLSA